jgi:hypothetical protein
MIEICRDHCTNVKRWKDGTMALRWCAAGMVEARRQFRRVNGHLHLRQLRAALEAHIAATTSRRSTGKEEAASRITDRGPSGLENPAVRDILGHGALERCLWPEPLLISAMARGEACCMHAITSPAKAISGIASTRSVRE